MAVVSEIENLKLCLFFVLVGLKNVRCKKEDELTTTTIINDVEVAVNEDAKTANKKSGRIES